MAVLVGGGGGVVLDLSDCPRRFFATVHRRLKGLRSRRSERPKNARATDFDLQLCDADDIRGNLLPAGCQSGRTGAVGRIDASIDLADVGLCRPLFPLSKNRSPFAAERFVGRDARALLFGLVGCRRGNSLRSPLALLHELTSLLARAPSPFLSGKPFEQGFAHLSTYIPSLMSIPKVVDFTWIGLHVVQLAGRFIPLIGMINI